MLRHLKRILPLLNKYTVSSFSTQVSVFSACKLLNQRGVPLKISCVRQFATNGILEPKPDEISEIIDNDREKERLLKVIVLEIDLLKQEGNLVPEEIDKEEWKELLLLKSRSSRIRFLNFLFKNERKRENKQVKAEAKRIERLEKMKELAENPNNHITYGFNGSTIFLRIYDSTMDTALNSKLMNAAMFSQHIVMDLSYDNEMTRNEARNCAKQLCMSFAINRNHPEPFHFQFCNVNPNSYLVKCLKGMIPPMYDIDFPFFATQESYLDLYPKERLVYLTPHCREDLMEYNHDDVYIIGGMVDKAINKPLSLARAKENGLRMAKLPLDKFLVWGSGASKSLTLNQVLAIMLDMRHHNDWNIAFQHVPRRKLVDEEQLKAEAAADRKKRLPKGFYVASKFNNEGDVHISSDILRRIKSKRT